MYEIPLFPLKSVLFPRTPLELHIFEERYKLMINECLDNSSEFGVVLIAEGQEANGPLAKPHNIGCKARINQYERLSDGRLNIVLIGTERFKIVQTSNKKPYLTANVLPYPLTFDAEFDREKNTGKLRDKLERYLGILTLAGGHEVDLSRIPNDPVNLVYTAAHILQTSAENKQLILESEGITEIFIRLSDLYRRETALLSVTLSPPKKSDTSVFSNN